MTRPDMEYADKLKELSANLAEAATKAGGGSEVVILGLLDLFTHALIDLHRIADSLAQIARLEDDEGP